MSTIHIKKANRGKFTAYKKRTGKTTAEALHSKDPHVRQMANFARNAKKWHHAYGGLVEFGTGGILQSAGAGIGMIPTPYTKAIGGIMSLIGGVVAGDEQRKQAFEQDQQKRMTEYNAGLPKAFQYAPTFPGGGTVPDYTGLGMGFMNTPRYEGPTMNTSPTTGDRVHNFLSDLGTGVATWGTSLRRPTPGELEQGRGSWGDRIGLLANAAKEGMQNEMIGGAIAKAPAFVAKVGQGLKDEGVVIGKKATREIYKQQLQARDKATAYLEQWYNNPLIKERRNAVDPRYRDIISPPNVSTRVDLVNKNVAKGKYFSPYEKKEIAQPNIGGISFGASERAAVISDPHKLFGIPLRANPTDVGATTVHEGAHNLYNDLHWNSYFTKDLINKTPEANIVFNSPVDAFEKKVTGLTPRKTYFDKYKGYYNEPTEINSRNMEIRYLLNKKPGDPITADEIKSVTRENYATREMFRRIKLDDKYVNFINNTFADGGLTPNGTPVEVERGEVMRDPEDGSMAKIGENAPTHAQGGVDIAAEPGTQIFGKLKVKSGRFAGMTYKDAADNLRKEIARLEK